MSGDCGCPSRTARLECQLASRNDSRACVRSISPDKPLKKNWIVTPSARDIIYGHHALTRRFHAPAVLASAESGLWTFRVRSCFGGIAEARLQSQTPRTTWGDTQRADHASR